MWMEDGYNSGYFAWSVQPDGTKNSYGPAPMVKSIMQWPYSLPQIVGEMERGIYNYSKEARAILHECVHKGSNGKPGSPMWEPSNKLIKFVPNCDFTDPSYHLPHFYELFALWANEEDREFWKEVAKASRDYLHLPATL